jgi:hypothetical protein
MVHATLGIRPADFWSRARPPRLAWTAGTLTHRNGQSATSNPSPAALQLRPARIAGSARAQESRLALSGAQQNGRSALSGTQNGRPLDQAQRGSE